MDRQLGRPGPAPCAPAAVFGAIGGMEAVRLQGEPCPDVSPRPGATGVDLLRQEPGKQVR